MTINSVNNYSSYSFKSLSNLSASDNNQQSLDGVGRGSGNRNGHGGPKGAGGPGGPGGPGGAGRLGEGRGPKIDQDSNGSWSETEVSDFASKASENLGISIDVNQIFDTYDTNDDGSISSDEIKKLASENGFNLPSPQEMMKSMDGGQKNKFRMNNQVDLTKLFDQNDSEDSILSFLNDSTISKSLEAYESNNTYNNADISSLLDLAL
ncbi:EF-hand domain-containing protein [Helicovermis profundi]|uniref:EF-hand domain-containing protein n=1 Tax=Helicovermis profundi TaxID=3065157 RepID=A0AAU9EDW8_9FIRM|nr:hypothetical protein HLPR_26280 [Clostridia bacterium S502]